MLGATRGATDTSARTAPPAPLVRAPEALLENPSKGCPTPNVYRAPGATDRRVALTFDDGPAPGDTDEILSVLREEEVKATFFDVGKFAVLYPELQYREAREGHDIGVHGFSHQRFTTLSANDVVGEVKSTAVAIARNTGRAVCFVRPPYGDVNDGVIRVIGEAGYSVALWNVDSRDWTRPEVATMVRSALVDVHGQPVTVLMHTSSQLVQYDNAAVDKSSPQSGGHSEALRTIIRRYKAAGYQFVGIDGQPFPGTGTRAAEIG